MSYITKYKELKGYLSQTDQCNLADDTIKELEAVIVNLQKQFDVIMLENLALLEREVELNKRIEELESDDKMVQDGVTTTMRENMELTIKVLSLEDVICGISESIDSLHNN